jgi:hypothetical protein
MKEAVVWYFGQRSPFAMLIGYEKPKGGVPHGGMFAGNE